MARPPRDAPQSVFTVTDLEQVKVLADPLRLRILSIFAEGERTTKQVALALGEKPTRLYHHVQAIERVGLIRPTRTRQNRGTVERYYVAAGRTFEAAPGVFGSGGRTLRTLATSVLESTGKELAELIAAGHGDCLETEGILIVSEIRADPRSLARIRSRLSRVLAALQRAGREKKTKKKMGKQSKVRPAERRFRLTLAFFPLDRTSPS